MKHTRFVFAACACLGAAALNAAPDILIENFERDTYAPWTVEGEAFRDAPDAAPREGQPYRFDGIEGARLANSFDAKGGTGTLSSPDFVVARDYITFRIAGGEMASLGVRLLVDGQPVRTQIPYRTRELLPAGWNVSEFKGKTARIEIFDRAKGANWDEFIMVDDLRQSDTPAVVDWEQTIPAKTAYLNMPIGRMGVKSTLSATVDGKTFLRTPIMPAHPDKAESWASIPLGAYAGKSVKIKIENLPYALADVALVQCTDILPGNAPLYEEPMRPQFHFTAQRGWINDPNGMVYADGKWHLYFQHDPYSLNGLTKYWGHAVSQDLVHWTELPTALSCFVQAQGKVYSGSALVDVKNRSGCGVGGNAPLIALFTDTGFGEALAYSNDGGLTFTYLPENPVYAHRGRDPKILWYPAEEARTQENGHFVMAVFSDTPDKKRVIDILTSDNLREWTKTDTVENYFECPELIYLPILDAQGQPTGKSRWVIWGADGGYQTGTFDGEDFVPDSEKLQTLHRAPYAGQCFNQAPDGRVVQIAWLRIGWGGEPFTQMYSVPMEMTLRETPDGVRLYAYPIEELARLRGQARTAEGVVGAGKNLSLPVRGQALDILCAFDAPQKGRVVLSVGAERVVYDAAAQTLDGVAMKPVAGKITLRVLLDRPSIEIFGNGGAVVVARRRADMGKDAAVRLSAEDGAQTRATLEAYEMRSIWKK